MKVLFAVSNEEISEAIIKRYQKQYKEIISYKNVYYFNAILKEIQKDKTYDRIVISEELEAFTNSQYDQIDRFIFDKLDSISDEASNTRGDNTPIILICSDRRNKGEEMLVKLFGIGIYDALIGNDRGIEEVCHLINKPRSKKEAKLYYKIESEDVKYQAENENDVSEQEIQNILAHYKKLGKNEERYVTSFDNIVAQYNDAQLRIISKFLPLNVRAVLEEKSPKYQQVMSFNNAVSNNIRKTKKKTESLGPSGKLLRPKNKAVIPTEPIVIPNAVDTSNVKKLTRNHVENNNNGIQGIEDTINQSYDPFAVDNMQFNNFQSQNNYFEDSTINNAQQDEYDDELSNLFTEPSEPKKRGRKSKKVEETPIQETVETTTPKRRGRPRKNPIENPVETDVLPGIKNYSSSQSNKEDNGFEEPILPGFEKESYDNYLPGFEEEQQSSLNSEVENQQEENDELLPGFEDYNSYNQDSTQNYNAFSQEPTQSYNSFSQQQEEGYNPFNQQPEQNYNPFNQQPEEDYNPFSQQPEQNYNQFSQQPEQDYNTYNQQPEQDYDSFDQQPVQNDFYNNNNVQDYSAYNQPMQNLNNDDFFSNTQYKNNYQQSYDGGVGDLARLLTDNKKIATFVGTSKNGTSFIVNNLAEYASSMGINVAIFDTTKNKNSYYIYTKNEEELRKNAAECLVNLTNGQAKGISVNRNLTVYTSLPEDREELNNVNQILETLLRVHDLILIDCDFDTPYGYFANSQEIYLVQTYDILTIQPLTAFLRELKAQNILDQNKIRILLNKHVRVRGISEKTIVGGMSKYNDPAMSFMTDLFDVNAVKYMTIQFEQEIYTRYLESVINCDVSIKGYSKTFMQTLKELNNWVYQNSMGNNSYRPQTPMYNNTTFSASMNDTLNQMRKKY